MKKWTEFLLVPFKNGAHQTAPEAWTPQNVYHAFSACILAIMSEALLKIPMSEPSWRVSLVANASLYWTSEILSRETLNARGHGKFHDPWGNFTDNVRECQPLFYLQRANLAVHVFDRLVQQPVHQGLDVRRLGRARCRANVRLVHYVVPHGSSL